jgi:hypothetical protein
MLAHTDKLAVFVAELLVYSTGLTFALQLAQHSSFADQRLVDAWLQPPHLVGKDRPFFGVDYADDRYTVHDSWAADDPGRCDVGGGRQAPRGPVAGAEADRRTRPDRPVRGGLLPQPASPTGRAAVRLGLAQSGPRGEFGGR